MVSIGHPTFQIRKLLLPSNSNQTTRHSVPGAWTTGDEHQVDKQKYGHTGAEGS